MNQNTTVTNRGRPNRPFQLEITMSINFDVWCQGNWYDAISFSDSVKQDKFVNGKRKIRPGRSFETEVERNQKIVWKTELHDNNEKVVSDKRIILISVVRNPENRGDFLLDRAWYNSQDNGDTIEGYTIESFRECQEEGYIISFAIDFGKSKFDIYTVDPIIRGNR